MVNWKPIERLALLTLAVSLGGCGLAPSAIAPVPQTRTAPSSIAVSPSAAHVSSYRIQQYMGELRTEQQGDQIVQYRWDGYQWVYVTQWPAYTAPVTYEYPYDYGYAYGGPYYYGGRYYRYGHHHFHRFGRHGGHFGRGGHRGRR